MEKNYIPPQDINAEKAIIGCLLIENSLISDIILKIKPSDFYLNLHGELFGVAIKMFTDNIPVDIITLSEKMQTNNSFKENGSMTYLTHCIDTVATTANWISYVEIVRNKSILRGLLQTTFSIQKKIADNNVDIQSIIDFSQKQISDVVIGSIEQQGFVTTQDLASEVMDRIEQRHRDKSDVPGLKTYYSDLDKIVGGIAETDLVIVAGRPSMGKTTFALNIMLKIAKEPNSAVAIFSLEMGKHSLMDKFIANMSEINSKDINRGNIQENEWVKLSDSVSKLARQKIYIKDTFDNVLNMKTLSRDLFTKLKLKKIDLKVIVVDYMQLIGNIDGEKAESQEAHVAAVSRNLKALAKDLKVPVIALSQLSRENERGYRKTKRPQLSDLRGSGAIEQDADIVMFVHRDAYYDRTNPDIENDALIIVAKNRNGATGECTLHFEKEYSKFSQKAYQSNY